MSLEESDPNFDFMRHILPTIDWEGLLIAATAVGLEGFPAAYSESLDNDEEFLMALHRLLIDVRIQKATLICPESGRTFPVENGIPDMRIPESECI